MFSTVAVDVMEAIGNASERHLFMQFYSHLGIEDETQLVFLSTMLRAVFDATSKLDRHLAKYGASLHCAVSRMVVSKNPREAPSHRWIRVLDRLGFFTDGDKHAERIVNIGMAFAYRQLEVDALADANAVLLRQAQPSTAVANGEIDSALHPGGEVGSTFNGDKTAAAAVELPGVLDHDFCEEDNSALPTGGLVVSADPAPSNGADGGDRGDGGEAPLPLGGMVVSSITDGQLLTTGGRPCSLGEAGGGGLSALEGGRAKAPQDHGGGGEGEQDHGDADADDGGGTGPVPSHVVHEWQPTVLPPASAVSVVASVIQDVSSRSGGPDVMRKLLDDSILCVARTRAPVSSHRGLICPTGSKADWAAVTRMCTGWWPQWIATPDVPTLPPVGTVSRRLFKHRLARTSRWVLKVNMEVINETLDEISVRSSRFFPKTKLAAVEEVVRINATSAMRLPVVVASMLLLCTKEDRFAGVLSELASVGRVDINKAAPLHQASRHEFSSSGLASASTSLQAAPSRHVSPPDPSAAAAAALHDRDAVNMNDKYADMEVALHNEDVSVAALNRADRMRRMRASQTVPSVAARSAAIGVPLDSGDAVVLADATRSSAPSLPLSTSQNPPPGLAAPSASQISGVSAGRPPRGVKRTRAPRTPRRSATQGAAAKANYAKAAVAKAAAAKAASAQASAATARGAVTTSGSGSASGGREGDAAATRATDKGGGVVQVMSGGASTAAAFLPMHPQPISSANFTLTNAMAAAPGGQAFGQQLEVGASPAVGVVDLASLQRESGTTQQDVPLGQPDAPHPLVSPSVSPAGANGFFHQGAGLVPSEYSPLHGVVGGGGVAGVPSEGGQSAAHVAPSTSLSFVEESRARRARVEADLRDANASLTHILHRKGGGAGQN